VGRLGLRMKLGLLIMIPILLLCGAGSYALLQTRGLTETLMDSLYASTYKSSELLLNADRDMYQAMAAVKSAQAGNMDSETYAAHFADFEENVAQAAERIDEAEKIWADHRELLRGIDEKVAMTAQFANASGGLRHWRDAAAPVLTRLADASDAERAAIAQELNDHEALFDASREGLNQLEELIDTNASVTVADLEAKSDRLFLTFILSVVISAALVLLMGWLLARNIRQSLIRLAKTANSIAEGELPREELAVQHARDEIGELQVSMNSMTAQLRDLIGAMTDVSKTVTVSSRELTASADQTRQATGHIAESMQEMSAGAEQTAASVTADSQRVARIVMSADYTRSLLQDASELANQVDSRATEGTRVIHHAVDRMETVEQAVLTLSASVDRLRRNSMSIAEFLETITQIASRTNVLALNASIEASRAGEQGRGFAVVAAEIRKLAEQASRAASEAGELADNIVDGTTEATEAMALTGTEVATGLASVREANLSFESIGRDVSQVAAQMTQMDEAAQQLESEARETDQSLGLIAETVSRIADDIQDVSAAAEEQLASMEEVSGAAQTLSRLAEELQAIIGRFNVK
jgi:methyl-accepting chemotaxis protein